MNILDVETVVDSERGCGWRKPGGLYLRLDGNWDECGKLPVPLEVCPCCSAGIKPARGWTWFDPAPFLNVKTCRFAQHKPEKCELCPMQHCPPRAGLLWVGEKFYPTPEDWTQEAKRLGISRRIPRVPYGFEIGDRVYMAHRKCIENFETSKCDCQPMNDLHTEECACRSWTAGIFTSFVPDRIEYVLRGDETGPELDALIERGITPVKVIRDIDCPDQGQATGNQAGQPENSEQE